ncbi:MAG: guanylate kinase [Planctomycetota bacterium]
MFETGKLIIISGPSGVGKTTVLKKLFEQCKLPLQPSISATTRPQRAGETAGVSYHYLSDEEFRQRRENDEFLECVEVFGRGHWYGTLKKPVSTGLNEGKWIVLEIDVDGAAKALKHYPDAITIFIHPGSLEELEKRLRGRGTESEEALSRRLEVARRELEAANRYQHRVTNESVEQTVEDICQLLEALEKP